MRKFLALIFSVLIIICISVPVFADTPLSDDIVILYTNDIHTYIDNDISYDVIAAVKNDLKTQYKNVFLVDAGDHIQGTAYGSMDNGKSIIELMNASGYDAATLGNHEFDYGMLGCMKVIDMADYPYLSCNFYHEENGVKKNTVLDAYKIFDCGSEKIAFVGITTPETFTKSTPAYFQDENGNYIYGISAGENGEDLYKDVQKAIDDAKAHGATKVIALAHLGDDESSAEFSSESVIKNVSGFDAFIDGHSHSVVKGKEVTDKDSNSILITQTGEYFNRIGIMVIDSDSGEITSDFIEITEDGKLTSSLYTKEEVIRDSEVTFAKEEWINTVDGQLNVVIGTSEVVLDNYDENSNRLVRSQETNTGDFCADALYYLFDNMGLDVDLAIMNGGGIRNKAITGELSYKICKDIHTFGNVACLQEVSGQQILDALEWGARFFGESENGGFLHVSGLTYEIDTSVKSTVQSDSKGVWTAAPTGEYRVHNVKIYNKETNTYENLDLSKKYNLAGYNYTLRDLGDGFAMFDGAVNILDYVMEDYMVLANYVKGFEDETVSGKNSPLLEKYPNLKLDYSDVNGSGRITENKKIVIGGTENDKWISKYGNVYLSISSKELFDKGFEMGDVVKVSFLDKEIEMPIVPSYSYVESGKPAVIVKEYENGEVVGYVSLAINMGNFAETYEIAKKKTDDEGNYCFEAFGGVTFPIEVNIEIKEKGGYLSEYLLRSLNRTNSREDYADLTDEEFANFRQITLGDIGKNRLYRTSSPINPEIGRNSYALKALEEAGVTVIMNLADSREEAQAYGGFEGSYYEDQKVIYLNLGVDFSEESFKEGLAKGLRFFAENKGVYAVHCNEGKDRAGFVSAILECLMGASCDEVIKDYMVAYYNYYGVEEGSEKYNAIANSNIVKSLSEAFEVSDLSKADLSKEAHEYIKSLGVSDGEIEKLKENLSKDYVKTPQTGDETHIIYWSVSFVAALIIINLINKKEKPLLLRS